jgi:RNA polymerase sigma-70 factor (ECF subfamily)
MSASLTPPSAVTGDDADFVARIAAGDRDAEAEFVRRYQRGIAVLVRRHCRPGDPIVDDIAQDVLTRVLERLRAGAIRDSAALPGYLQTAISHAASAEYRSRRPSEPIEAVADLASAGTPAQSLHAEQLQHTLHALLAELPVARDRELLRRFYLNEEDKDDVCRQLGVDTGHFHRVMFRARERFRTLLEQAGIGKAGT